MKTKLFAIAAMLGLLCACQAQMHAGADTFDMESGPPLMSDPADNPDMTKFAAEVDSNNDGRLSQAEWQAKGLPSSSFDMFERGRGYVTLRDYQENAAPPGIDLNGDGEVTVAEFIRFDRQMSPPPGAPPQQ